MVCHGQPMWLHGVVLAKVKRGELICKGGSVVQWRPAVLWRADAHKCVLARRISAYESCTTREKGAHCRKSTQRASFVRVT